MTKKTRKTAKKEKASKTVANVASETLFKTLIDNLPTMHSMYSRRPIKMGTVLVNVALAYAILEHNICNRVLRQGTINGYVKDMKSKMWTFCSAMLVLSDEGVLLDGQHRLYAIIESGEAQEFTIVYGLHQDIQKYIDIGPGRSLADVLKLDGLVDSHYLYTAGIINRMMCGTSTNYGKTRTEQLAFFAKHRESILWGVRLFKDNWRQEVSTAPVASAVIRASYYTDDLSELKRFVYILKEGIATENEKVVIAFRDWMLRPEYKGGAPKAAEIFLRTQGAIRAFIKGKRVKRSLLPEKDLFPLPETDPATGIGNGSTARPVSWYRKHFNGNVDK